MNYNDNRTLSHLFGHGGTEIRFFKEERDCWEELTGLNLFQFSHWQEVEAQCFSFGLFEGSEAEGTDLVRKSLLTYNWRDNPPFDYERKCVYFRIEKAASSRYLQDLDRFDWGRSLEEPKGFKDGLPLYFFCAHCLHGKHVKFEWKKVPLNNAVDLSVRIWRFWKRNDVLKKSSPFLPDFEIPRIGQNI